ncbi:MAG: APC family permease [Sulfolobaceae archaeon]|nr:APC family permease [Sulfolobaceae archaeon]
MERPQRVLNFLDIVFLSLGGQSPFLSILTYGAVVIATIGTFAPIAVILGTLLTLINGLTVYELSKRFTKEGGYYTYAWYSLTKKLGLETGWVYILYSSFYGSAYILGTTYLISHIFNVNPWFVILFVLFLSSLFMALGIRPSSKYAIFASSLEIGILVALSLLFISSTGFRFYNPFHVSLNFSKLFFAILFGSSIPTGYGSIAPISGEVKNPKRTVSMAIVTVILLGGLLASFDIYGILDHLVYFHISLNGLDILKLIESKFGLLTLIFVIFAAFNDGVLGSLSFMLATSRTIFAMAENEIFPKQLTKLAPERGPIYSNYVTIMLYILSSLTALYIFKNPFVAFEIVGGISLLANLFVHIASNFSLLRISLRRISKRLLELIIAVIAAIYSIITLVYSSESSATAAIDFFLLFIIAGFLFAEIRDMAINEEPEERK